MWLAQHRRVSLPAGSLQRGDARRRAAGAAARHPAAALFADRRASIAGGGGRSMSMSAAVAGLRVLHCDNHILAVEKPAGMIVAPDISGDVSLLEVAKAWVKREYSKPGDVRRPPSGACAFITPSGLTQPPHPLLSGLAGPRPSHRPAGLRSARHRHPLQPGGGGTVDRPVRRPL